ncbi:MAG: homocysteine S-methyltransferase family protein [bacterium]
MNILDELIRKKIVILDGATGTNLFERGLLPGEPPAFLNLKNPEAVYELQKEYVDAGSDVILTNTFSANPSNFKDNRYKKVIKNGIMIARRAAGNKKIIFGDVGPLGILIKPYGDGDFEKVYDIYSKIFQTFCDYGVRTFLIETFNSIIEAKAAFLAAKNYTDDILVSFTFQKNCRTLFGELPESIAITFEKLGAKAIGVNCTEPDTTIEVLKRMSFVTNLPLIAKPNAGKVMIEDNKVKNSISDKELAKYFESFVKAGARLIGGCCGTTPEYIKAISHKNVVAQITGHKIKNKKFFLVSPQKVIEVWGDSTVLIGERLNPSGRKKFRESLINGDYAIYGKEARSQEDAGVDAIDINAFVPELDEGSTLLNCLYEVLKSSKLPIIIDTQNFSAAEKAMMIYPGIGVYNSIPAREKELRKFLPLVMKFGFKAVISLVGSKIPHSFTERMQNVRLVLKIAKKLKFPKEDLIFDALVFSVATGAKQTEETLKTVKKLNEMDLKTILGISNVSFGLPERSFLNSALVNMAIRAGVNFLILNPLDQIVMGSFYATSAIYKKKINEYINWAKQIGAEPKNRSTDFGQTTIRRRDISPVKRTEDKASTPKESLIKAIVNGNCNTAVEYVKKMLDSGSAPQKIIDDYVFNSMKTVGENYEQGIFFIPDLLKSAEATKAVLEVIKKETRRPGDKETGRQGEIKKIVLATVKGDIHDIGKNIVSMVFESAGYEVVDLGKDVEATKIVEAVRKYKPVAVGLSALLTTTMPEMGNVIKLLRKNGFDTPVIIGGPNVSEGFAKKIGAYAAVQNAFDGLKIIKKIG